MATILDNGICEHNRPVLTQETDQLVSDHDSRHKASLPTSSMVWCASVTTLSNKGFEGNGPCSGMCGTLLHSCSSTSTRTKQFRGSHLLH
ncbi:uncharacterized protein [Dermacentor andersoni]|uniref:uncharacterized protein isoform X2 n=1 Tax=Dermacentor andersoni TaxID=34620 RepID=UPI003B3B5EF4